MKTTLELNEKEKNIIWNTLNQAAQKNQENATATGDKFKKEYLKTQNDKILSIAALFAPGSGKTTISQED